MPKKQNDSSRKNIDQIVSSSQMRQKGQHVVPTDEGWAVIGGAGKNEIARGKTQREAISMAREIALGNHTEVIIHSRNGVIAGRERLIDEIWELDSVLDESESIHKYIDFKFYGTRPHIRGRRLLVTMVAANEQADQLRISELASDFSLSVEEVLAAILYYREHKSDLDQQDLEEQKLFNEMYEQHGETNR